jgi:hypothetical protein
MEKERKSAQKTLRERIPLASLLRNLMRQAWFRISPIFFVGTVITAAGTTVDKSDTVVFVGMVIMGLGVVAMWLASTGKPSLKSATGPLAFIGGSVLTAMSMTISPSNPLLCGGMILTGVGTIAMWLVGKWGRSSALVAILFTAGVAMQAVGLTVVPSDMMIMGGMIVTGIGAFAMWAYESGKGAGEEGKTSEEKAPVTDTDSRA